MRNPNSKNTNRLRRNYRQDSQSPPTRAPHIPLLGHNDLKSRKPSASLPFQPAPRLHQYKQIPNRLHPSPKLLLYPPQRQRRLLGLAHERIRFKICNNFHSNSQRDSENSHTPSGSWAWRYSTPWPALAVFQARCARQVPCEEQRYTRCYGRCRSRSGYTLGRRRPQL